MARLICSAIASLDGYVADEDGGFDWAAPDEEVHAFVNDEERPVGTYLYGRRLYDVLAVWGTMPAGPDPSPAGRHYAEVWRWGRRCRLVPTRRPRSATTRRSGGRPRRSSTRAPSTNRGRRAPGSSAT